MGLEIEIKYLDVDHAVLRSELTQIGAVRVGAWFESNTVFDSKDRTLRALSTLLRLRTRAGHSILTLKRKPEIEPSHMVKTYEEWETEVSEPVATRAILAGIGYHPAFAYEKIREKWTYRQAVFCLDTLPFGHYLEIEADEPLIVEYARLLHLDPANASTATYHRLNREYRQAQGLAPDENFVFDAPTRKRLMAELEAAPSTAAMFVPSI